MVIVNFKNSKGLNLVGDLYEADSDKVVILCHGFTGSRKEASKFTHCAKELKGQDINALFFDFGGSGDSYDCNVTVTSEIEDPKAAIMYVKERGFKSIGLVGFSLGGFISLNCYSDEIKAMVLWNPLTFSYDFLEEVGLNFNDVDGGKVIGVDHPNRDKLVLDNKFFDETTNIDRAKLLSGVKCPVLIIQGMADEDIPFRKSMEADKLLPDSRIELIKGATHSFAEDYFEDFSELTAGWFFEKL